MNGPPVAMTSRMIEAVKVVHARDRLHEAGEAIIAAIDEALGGD